MNEDDMTVHRSARAGIMAFGLFALAALPALSQGTGINLGIRDHDSSAPVEITSETLSLDQESGSAKFTGGVLVRQGEMTLSTDELVVQYAIDADTGQQQIDVIRMFGGVTFASESDAAEAESAVYTLANDTLVMSGSVLVTQGITAVAADKLTYNLESGVGQMQGNVKTVLRQGGN